MSDKQPALCPNHPEQRLRIRCFLQPFEPPFFRDHRRAFTRIELLAIIATIGLLALVIAPALAGTKSDSERLICFNNLRLIGRGYQAWAGDHNQQLPWRAPDPDNDPFTLNSEGEWTATDRSANAWQEFRFISNDLVTPKILACPSDTGVMRATNWPQFTTSLFRAKALSYSVDLHAAAEAPHMWLSADRNIRASPYGHCWANVIDAAQINTAPSVSNVDTEWLNAVHGTVGHMVFADGSVEFTSTQRLKEVMFGVGDNGSTHFLRAR
jgi:type II secretory pathway pseudopilin PulG